MTSWSFNERGEKAGERGFHLHVPIWVTLTSDAQGAKPCAANLVELTLNQGKLPTGTMTVDVFPRCDAGKGQLIR